MNRFLTSFLLLLALSSCTKGKIALLDPSQFDTLVDGKKIALYTLSNDKLTMQVTNYGARVVALWTPDRKGHYADVVLGYPNIERYLNNQGERYLGAAVGRYANRIANGRFTLDGTEYTLPTNNNGQCLHGGDKGFDRVVWDVTFVTDSQIMLRNVSPDGDDGFPATLTTNLTYTLTANNEFRVEYSATSDATTVVNPSHHSFFNLKGEGCGTILDNELTINSSYITPVDSVLIPTGEIAPVGDTPFDFRTPTAIGARINEKNTQLRNGNGYDHNWVIDRKSADKVELAATLYEPQSGRTLDVLTDQPALQFYSGNFFDGTTSGKSNNPLKYRESVVFESQKYPDSPNHENFPTTILHRGEIYTHTCVYRFGTRD